MTKQELIEKIQGLKLVGTHIGPLFNTGWEGCRCEILKFAL